MDTLGSTKSNGVAPKRQGASQASLCAAFRAHRPLDRGSRHALDVDEVEIGRGEAFACERLAVDGRRKLVLRIPDPRISTVHARLTRDGGTWTLRDAGSKNGSFANGRLVESKVLADADVLEIGGSFFVFREDDGNAVGDDAPLDAGAAALGVPTLNAPFATALLRLAQVARSTIPVLLLGESGTGKEVIARALHAASGRSGPFFGVNCGALPATLVESELFGCKKGAFSGAVADRVGVLRAADRGTLLFDEIGDLALVSQAALLRVLQEREVVPVGDTHPVAVDLRVVSATHRDLAQLEATGAFRQDLLARLSGFEMRVPPLRDRREDIGTLVRAFMLDLAPDRADTVGFTRRAARAIHLYPWPNNVRELKKCIEAALVLAGTEPIDLAHLPARVVDWSSEPSREAVAPSALTPADERRRAQLVTLFERHGGNITAVARELGKARVQIQRWVKRYAIRLGDYRRP